MILVDVDIGKNAHLWFRDGERVVEKIEEFIPEFYVLGENLDELLDLKIKGIKYVKNKKIKTIDGVYDGIAIGTIPSYFYNIVENVDRFGNFSRYRIYNGDVRLSVMYLSWKKLFPFWDGSDRFSILKNNDLKILEMKYNGNVKINNKSFEENSFRMIEEEIESQDPDIIIFWNGDKYLEKIVPKFGKEFKIGRRYGWREIKSREYFSYGREYYRERAFIPRGRIIIDPLTSFLFNESGIDGIIHASRISGLQASYAARSTPGTLVSTMEVYTALLNGIGVPMHKTYIEKEKDLETLVKADRGGVVFQPVPGFYWNVYEIDYTSMYPSIIVTKNLSPETVNVNCNNYITVPEINYTVCMDKRGFLSQALESLLKLRILTKKSENERIKKIDKALKWMLVTSFGYTGYRNAKFGSIEVHEAINAFSRDILVKTKEIAEINGFRFIHGIVDSIWVEGNGDIEKTIKEINEMSGLFIDLSGFYTWLKIIKEKGGDVGALNRYIARKSDGSFKIRGIMLRRSDTPKFISNFQGDCLKILSSLDSPEKINDVREKIINIYRKYLDDLSLRKVNAKDLLIEKRVSRVPWEYEKNIPQKNILDEFFKKGIELHPGERIKMLVYNEKPVRAVGEEKAENVDYSITFYSRILRDALLEIIP